MPKYVVTVGWCGQDEASFIVEADNGFDALNIVHNGEAPEDNPTGLWVDYMARNNRDPELDWSMCAEELNG